MKKIGILGWKTGLNSFGITLAYYRFLTYYGEVVVIEPNNEINEELDLLVLPGGPDLDTTQYEIDKFNMDIGKPCPIRTHFMEKKLDGYIQAGIPLFGICLGHQMLAAHTGNKLIPHMYHETNEEERDELVHGLDIDGIFAMDKELEQTMKVNSLHHQAVCSKNVVNASVLATYKPAKKSHFRPHVEALKYEGFKGYSVQWHPEEIYDRMSHKMITELLEV